MANERGCQVGILTWDPNVWEGSWQGRIFFRQLDVKVYKKAKCKISVDKKENCFADGAHAGKETYKSRYFRKILCERLKKGHSKIWAEK